MFCVCFVYVLHMFCVCCAYVLRMFCACFARVLRMFCACFACVLRVFCACFARVLDFGKFQAVIKSAASAASPRPNQGIKSGNPRSGERPDDGARWDDGAGRATDRIRATARGAPLELPSLDFAFGEAALAADLITA